MSCMCHGLRQLVALANASLTCMHCVAAPTPVFTCWTSEDLLLQEPAGPHADPTLAYMMTKKGARVFGEEMLGSSRCVLTEGMHCKQPSSAAATAASSVPHDPMHVLHGAGCSVRRALTLWTLHTEASSGERDRIWR